MDKYIATFLINSSVLLNLNIDVSDLNEDDLTSTLENYGKSINAHYLYKEEIK